jgi:hypothetical protein
MKLNQVIAIEKGVKSKVQSGVDGIYKQAQKPANFEGFLKQYRAKTEDAEDVPNERQNVQLIAGRVLKQITERWTELFDVTAQKDFANCSALANVVLNGNTILTQVPVTYLLFLEKQLVDLHTIVSKFPTLDPAEKWTFDADSELNRTEPTFKTRTKKMARAIVLYPATTEHPAQTQLISEDISVGTYEHVKFSGAMPEPEQRRLLARIEALTQAIKSAREEANMIEAPAQSVAEKVFGYVFGA